MDDFHEQADSADDVEHWTSTCSDAEFSQAIVDNQKHTQVLERLLQSRDVIHRVIASQNQEALTIVLRCDVDVESRSTCNFTPLYAAVELNDSEAVRSLLEHGVELETVVLHSNYSRRHVNGLTALRLAVHKGYVEIAEQLLKAGASVHHTNSGLTSSSLYLSAIKLTHSCRVDQTAARCRLLFLLAEHGLSRSEDEAAVVGELGLNGMLLRLFNIKFFPGMCSLLAIGCSLAKHRQRFSARVFENMERQAVVQRYRPVIKILHESGYIFKHLTQISSSKLKSERDEILQLQATPLTLQRQTANKLRTCLQPNAIAGVKQIALPPGFDRTYITLSLTTDSIVEFVEDFMQNVAQMHLIYI